MALENARLPMIGRTAGEKTQRKDNWWLQPLATVIVFTAFVIYTTWRVFENNFFDAAFPQFGLAHPFHLLSPYYSPTFGTGFKIGSFSVSPAIWILPFPLLFRGTCYYYRKAYYRSYFLDPPACGVGEPAFRKSYSGERNFPMTVQNFHRYALYFAIIILAILWYDAIDSFRYDTGSGSSQFGVSVGSILFLANVVLISLYTFSCHSWRHLIGGSIDCFSCTGSNRTRHTLWEKISHLNENHALWAWLSLFSVALTDLYVREVCSGAIANISLF